MKVVWSSARPSQEGLHVAELQSALKAKELELKMLPGHAFENLTLLAEVSQLAAFVETPGWKRREIVMLT